MPVHCMTLAKPPRAASCASPAGRVRGRRGPLGAAVVGRLARDHIQPPHVIIPPVVPRKSAAAGEGLFAGADGIGGGSFGGKRAFEEGELGDRGDYEDGGILPY